MYRSIFFTIPKKLNAIKCAMHRTISLMSLITKIISGVIYQLQCHGLDVGCYLPPPVLVSRVILNGMKKNNI